MQHAACVGRAVRSPCWSVLDAGRRRAGKQCQGEASQSPCPSSPLPPVRPPARLQPETAAPIWNLRGVNCNSWHRVPVTVQ